MNPARFDPLATRQGIDYGTQRMSREVTSPKQDVPAATQAGKIAILSVVALSLAGSVGAWLYHRDQQRRPLELWGTRPARLIIQGTQATAMQLGKVDAALPSASGARTVQVDGQTFEVLGSQVIFKSPGVNSPGLSSPGFSYFRQCLLYDSSFDWNVKSAGQPRDWQFAVEFLGEEGKTTVLYKLWDESGDETSGGAKTAAGHAWVRLIDGKEAACIDPVNAGILRFLREQWPAKPASTAN